MVRDIREGPTEEYWDRLRQMMGPEGLITYWYLGRAFNQAEDPDTLRLRRDMREQRGRNHGRAAGDRRSGNRRLARSRSDPRARHLRVAHHRRRP